MYYAQIDHSGICIAVSQLAGKIEAEHMIEIDSYDEKLLGKRWNGTAWEDVPTPVPDPEPAEPVETADQKLDRLEEQNWILMGAVADLYETVLALKGGETA